MPSPHPPRLTSAEHSAQRAEWLAANAVRIEPFRVAFYESGMTISEFARLMGYYRTVPNIDQARRALGIRPDTDSRVGKRTAPREWCSIKQAHRMAVVLSLDPVDLDF